MPNTTGFPEPVATSIRHAIDNYRGSFKTEFTGDKMISLCSKTYIFERPDGTKMSSKGANKPDTLEDVYSKYEKLLAN